MAVVSYPGVYIDEVSSGVHTITGVSTSIGAFFGRAAQGPLNRAVRITTLSDYARTFGAPHPLSDLATSVRQFFDNGGSDCYVVRLARNAVKSNVVLKNIGVGPASLNVLTVSAKYEGLWGDGLRLMIDYNTPNPDESFNLRVIQEAAGAVVATERFTGLVMDPQSPRFAPTFLTQSSQLIDVALHANLGNPTNPLAPINTFATCPAGFSQSRRVFDAAAMPAFRAALTALFAASGHILISVNGEAFVDADLSGIVFAGTLVAMAAQIDGALLVAGVTATCSFDNIGGALQVLRITSSAGRMEGVRIRRAPANDLATAMMLGVEQGGIEVARFSNQRPVFTGSQYVGGAGFGAIANDAATGANPLAFLIQDPLAGGLASVSIGPTVVPVPIQTVMAVGSRWYQDATGGSDGVREKLRIIASTLNNDANVNQEIEAQLWGYHLVIVRRRTGINETLAIISAPPALLGNGIIDNVSRYALGTAGTGIYQNGAGAAGLDGTVPGVAEYVGNQLARTGFYALDGVDLFNLMVLPGDREIPEAVYIQLIGPASSYCSAHRAMLLVDAPESWANNNLMNTDAGTVNIFRGRVVPENSAVFYPRVRYSDLGVLKYIGPSGMIAGIMARTDSTRGVWKAPAGLEATVRGAMDLEVILSDRENGILNPLAVNCIRRFPTGIVSWGSRTLIGFDGGPSDDWKYIPVRRTALFLEESLYRGTQWIVFEPNDDPLWANIRKNLNAFMMGLFRQGAFQGSTPAQAFYVKCDGETTTQADRNLGIVNIEVGFAPLKPAEFVVIKIQQIAGDLT